MEENRSFSINCPKSAGRLDFYLQFKIELSDIDPVDHSTGACNPSLSLAEEREKYPNPLPHWHPFRHRFLPLFVTRSLALQTSGAGLPPLAGLPLPHSSQRRWLRL
jgi:hypothetical protein